MFRPVFPSPTSSPQLGADAVVHDPLFDDAELRRLGLQPYRLGEPCHAAIVQADHEMYIKLSPGDLPGIKVLLDGRGITRAESWESSGVRHLQLGIASVPL